MNEMRKALSQVKNNDDFFFLIPPGSKILIPVSAEDHSLYLLEALRRYSLYRKKDFALFPVHFLFSEEMETMEGFEQATHFEIEQERLARSLGKKNSSSAIAKLTRLAYAEEAKKRGCPLIALPTCFEEYLLRFRENLWKKGKLGSYSFLSPAPGGEASFIRPFLSLEEGSIAEGEKELLLPSKRLFEGSPLSKQARESFQKALFYGGDEPLLPSQEKRVALKEDPRFYFRQTVSMAFVMDGFGKERASFSYVYEDHHRLLLDGFSSDGGCEEKKILVSFLLHELASKKPPLWVEIRLDGFAEHPELGFTRKGDSIYRKIWRKEDILPT